jgi:nucleoside-diphosphate-sugar epimerase
MGQGERMATTFVTGGSGFIGGRLIQRLVAEGHTVRALARSEASTARVKELGAEPVPGDLADHDALRSGCDGAELVFHSAARTGPGGTWPEFTTDNVDGTRNVVLACKEAKAGRLVHVGTEAALMAGQPLINVDETAPLRPDSTAPYPATKARAERLVLEANGDELETVAVRPRWVWGAGDTSILPVLVAGAKSGKFAWIGGGRHLTDTTHVDNTVEGLMLAAQRGRPGEAYFITDGHPMVFREFLTTMLDTQGVRLPDRSVPLGMAKLIASLSDRAWTLLRRPGQPQLTPFVVWVSALQCTINISKARTELGYEPVRSHEDGFAELRASATK